MEVISVPFIMKENISFLSLHYLLLYVQMRLKRRHLFLAPSYLSSFASLPFWSPGIGPEEVESSRELQGQVRNKEPVGLSGNKKEVNHI